MSSYVYLHLTSNSIAVSWTRLYTRK